jgi:hypothetical protein
MKTKWQIIENGYYLEVRHDKIDKQIKSLSIHCYTETKNGLETDFETSRKVAQIVAKALEESKI